MPGSPKLLLGRLCKQFAGADVEEIVPGRQLSRVLFSVGQDKGIPVTDWQDIDDARSIDAKLLLHSATILGVVVGWIKVTREAPSYEEELGDELAFQLAGLITVYLIEIDGVP